MAPFDEAATHLVSIPGIGKRVAEIVVAKANKAVAHSILVACWHILSKATPYEDLDTLPERLVLNVGLVGTVSIQVSVVTNPSVSSCGPLPKRCRSVTLLSPLQWVQVII